MNFTIRAAYISMMTPAEVRIITTDWETHAGELRAVRENVFIKEQNVPADLEWDDKDAGCIHLLALSGTQPVGTARLLANGHIGRMAVLRDFRGRGIGSALLQSILETAHNLDLDRVFLHAQTNATGFYEKYGFQAYGENFTDAGIPHRAMRRKI